MQREEQPPVVLGPWTQGVVTAVDAYNIPIDGLLSAENVDIEMDGVATTRKKWDLLETANYHSLFEHNGVTYAGRENDMGVVNATMFSTITTIAGLMDWTVLDGKAVFTDFVENRIIVDGVPEALPLGLYADDEELEYQLTILPGGSEIYAWRGGLLVVRGNSLIWSEALRYGVYSAARDYIRFDERIMWAQPITTGVYVGLRNSVVFLSGSDPNKFTMRTVGGKSAAGVSAVLDTRHKGEGGEEVALWYTDVGVAVGQASGAVSYPQADRLKDMPLYPGKMVVEDDRVFIFTTQEH